MTRDRDAQKKRADAAEARVEELEGVLTQLRGALPPEDDDGSPQG